MLIHMVVEVAGLVVDGYRIDLFLLWVVVVDLTVLLMDLGRIAKLVDAWVVVYSIAEMELASVRLSLVMSPLMTNR